MDRRHDRDTEIDVASFITNSEPAVLRHATLGDVELRHDFDTRDQRLVIGEIDRIDFRVQRAVDSILDLNFRVASFDMNVRRARLHRVVDDRVDELDDRRHLGVGRQTIEIEHFLTMLGFSNKRDAKTRRCFLQHALCRIAFSQNDLDRAGSCDVRDNAGLERVRKFVQPLEIGWIRHRDVQTFLIAFQRHKLVSHHQVDRDLGEEFVVDWRLVIRRQKIDKRQTIAPRELFRGLHLRWLMNVAVLAVSAERRDRPDNRVLIF